MSENERWGEKKNEGGERAEGKKAGGGHTGIFRFFERLDFKDEENFIKSGKKFIFVLLIIVEFLILIQQLGACIRQNSLWVAFGVAIGLEAVLTVSEAVKLFVLKQFGQKMYCYAADSIAAFLLTAVTGSAYLCTLYAVILTEFYISSKKMFPSFMICLVSMAVYALTFWGSNFIRYGETLSPVSVITQSFNDFVVITMHFIVVNVAVRFYRQYLRLTKALKDLDTSNTRLRKAYDDLAEITLLEERQRIAKDIHDTAGHSITTVIMQTEAAKLLIDKNLAEAKSKIVAANLQAKHALEELRESVHLLSGASGKVPLKTALLNIINESSDGTGITIRWDIDELSVNDDKFRFICNSLKEGISNGMRHGGATAFWFELKEDASAGKISFLLSDNGAGVKDSKPKEGFGLSGMRSRAEKAGGEVQFLSEEGEGFEIRLTLPSDSAKGNGKTEK